jgi:hypothetical protein
MITPAGKGDLIPRYIYGIAIVSAIGLSFILIATNGSIYAACAFIAVVTILWITVVRIDWGLYIFIFFVYFFDQFEVPGMPSFTYEFGYFTNLSTISYLPRFESGSVTPMELHLLFILFLWLVARVLRGDSDKVEIPVKVPAMLFILALVGSSMQGWMKGGNIVISLWETRALAYLLVMFFLVPRIIQSKKQLHNLFWFCIVGISIKALQGAIRFASLGFSFVRWPIIYETLTSHEDAVFFVALFMFLIALTLFGGSKTQQRALLGLLGLLLVGFIAAQRRATYASFAFTFLAFMVLLKKEDLRVMIRPLIILAVPFLLYLGAYWNSGYSTMSTVALQVKATLTGEGGVRGSQDKSSTFYREVENYNLAYTFQRAPIVGIGFGMPFQTPFNLWLSKNKLATYIPHNQILWVFLKMGIIGGFCFWFFFNSYLHHGAQVFSKLSDPYLKAVCAVCIVSVFNQLVVSYVDMQLTFYRNMIHLGTLMGLIPVCEMLDRIDHKASERAPSSGAAV